MDVSGLSIRYPRVATSILKNVDIQVSRSEIVGLLGRSGCGKTTLLHTVAGLVPWLTPATVSGDVAIGGESVVELDPGQRAHLVSTCLDRPESQLFLATVRQEVEAARRLYGGDDFADAAVEVLDLGRLLDRRVTELSSGERQRVALAVALAGCPRPVLLDEPTTHLDAGAEKALTDLLGLAVRRGAPIIATEQAPWRLGEAVTRWYEIAGGRPSLTGRPDHPDLSGPDHQPGERVVLESRGVSLSRGGRRLVNGFDVDLHEGEIILLTGPNGSGKSTLALALAGLAATDAGEVKAAGRVGLMLPDAELQLFASTVAGEVAIDGIGQGERARVLRRHGLEHLAARAPWTLSRGEQQRLVHAALDLLRPEVMIIDEPTQGLDTEDLLVFLELVRRRSAKGRAYLVISHRPEVAAIAHRRFEVCDGRIDEVSG